MESFDELFRLLSLTLVTAAVLAWVNHRFVRLPTTIGVLVIAMGMSLGLHVLDRIGVPVEARVENLLGRVDFPHALLDVMLAFLLFAGALHVDLGSLLEQKGIVSFLATAGIFVSTLLVGTLIFVTCGALGLDLPYLHCLLFGALISPTDPIAVLSILKSVRAPKSLETKIAGESLFNDGIAVVLFALLAQLAGATEPSQPLDADEVILLLGREVFGSLGLGLVAGWIAYRMLKAVDHPQIEVFLTLALCTGVYSFAAALHASGPLAVVVAGLFVGNTGRALAMSEGTVLRLDTFWELVDEILNVVLFVLIGMEVLLLSLSGKPLVAGLLAIPLVLLARFLSVGGALAFLGRWRTFSPHAVKILTWGGIRGGISVALALSLPRSFLSRDAILTMSYVVVVFSIVVQGLTIGPLVRRLPDLE